MDNAQAQSLAEQAARTLAERLDPGWGCFVQVYRRGDPECRANYAFGICEINEKPKTKH